MREAARAFVETAIPEPQTASDAAITSISIIPYNAQVVLPDNLFAAFNVTRDHSTSQCVNFTYGTNGGGGQMGTLALSPTESIEQMAHVDSRERGYEDHPDYPNAEQRIKAPLCNRSLVDANGDPIAPGTDANGNPITTELNAIMPLETDADVLLDYIDTLQADGATGIDIGAKWGLALLDPAARPAIAASLDNIVSDRPYDYSRIGGTTRKVFVIMTDGKMNRKPSLRDEMRQDGTMSNFFYDEDSNRTSILLRGGEGRDPVQSANHIATGTYDDTEDLWYWVSEERVMPWPDTSYARVAWDYLRNNNQGRNYRWDEDYLVDMMVVGERGHNNDRVTQEDFDEWEKRDDWDILYPVDITDPLTPTRQLERLTWLDVFDRWEAPDFYDIYADIWDRRNENGNRTNFTQNEWDVYRQPHGNGVSSTINSVGNANLRKLCSLARDEGIEVYGITLNMSEGSTARNLIEECVWGTAGAKTNDRFQNVSDANLQDLITEFEKIAKNIAELRLTE